MGLIPLRISLSVVYLWPTGISRPPGQMQTADFVLKPFTTAEKKDLPFLISNAADATEMLIKEGLLVAQQRFHAN